MFIIQGNKSVTITFFICINSDVCELLLDYESDVDHVDRFNRTPLLAAASMGHSKVVEKLLFWGCYVDHIDFEGRTVLSVAAAQGCPVSIFFVDLR